jgi:hypothetical protein
MTRAAARKIGEMAVEEFSAKGILTGMPGSRAQVDTNQTSAAW